MKKYILLLMAALLCMGVCCAETKANLADYQFRAYYTFTEIPLPQAPAA